MSLNEADATRQLTTRESELLDSVIALAEEVLTDLVFARRSYRDGCSSRQDVVNGMGDAMQNADAIVNHLFPLFGGDMAGDADEQGNYPSVVLDDLPEGDNDPAR